MSTRYKVGTSLNPTREHKLREMLEHEPLVTTSAGLLAACLDVTHELWQRNGRDLKRAIGQIRQPCQKERAS